MSHLSPVNPVVVDARLNRPIMSTAYCQRLRQADYRIFCSRPGEPGYQQAGKLVADIFHKTYDARCAHFLPLLLSFKSGSNLHGAFGMHAAAAGALYLEQYLDKPVEQDISRCFMTPVARQKVVEIGNLVVKSPGTGLFMLALLGTVVQRAGLRWITFTATPQVEALLRKIRWQTAEICQADPGLLQDRDSQWGSYYACKPRVRAGNIEAASEFLNDPCVRGILSPYSALINRAVRALHAAGEECQ